MRAILFPGLDSLFVASKIKRWLDFPFIQQSLNETSSKLSSLTEQEEDLLAFIRDTHRPYLVDLDRSLVCLTVLQVSIATNLRNKIQDLGLIQGCSHGDIARSVMVESISLNDAIEILWTFTYLRKLLPEGVTATVRTKDGTPITADHIAWFETQETPISLWSKEHGTIGSDIQKVEALSALAAEKNLKIKNMLPFPVHTPALQPAIALLRETSNLWPVSAPRYGTVSSVWVRDITTSQEMKDEVLAGAVQPVRWIETLDYLYHTKKIREFINIGPSNTLTSWVFESNQYPELKVIEAWDLL
jgi:hypothetical protein